MLIGNPHRIHLICLKEGQTIDQVFPLGQINPGVMSIENLFEDLTYMDYQFDAQTYYGIGGYQYTKAEFENAAAGLNNQQ